MSSSRTQVGKRVVVPEDKAKTPVYAWHAHDWREVLAMLDVTQAGLSQKAVHRRLRQYGHNVFAEVPPPSVWSKIITQLQSPLTAVLMVAFLITLAFQEYLDAGVIAFALLITVAVGVIQEGKASRAFAKLSESQVKLATVIRDGQKHEIEAAELVPGDIVELTGGAQVPADVRLIKAKQLKLNEAALTGEWMGVNKHTRAVSIGTPFADQENMAWMGTYVSAGLGQGVVVATGDRTAVGELAQNLQDINDELTPLQQQMRQLSLVALYLIGGMVLFIFVLGLVQGQPLETMLLTAIAVAVASIPEGLPAAVTIVLAIGMEALLSRGGLVRNLLAAETLGSTTYVLTDKTGTLTEARMAVTGVIEAEATNYTETTWSADHTIRALFDVALCAADAYVDHTGEHDVTRGDPVEKAILEAAAGQGVALKEGSLRANRVDYLAFTSENRFAAGLAPHDGHYRLCINGAPEWLLEHATQMVTNNGVVPITDTDKDDFLTAMAAETKEGRRLVAVAYKDVEYDDIPEGSEDTLIDDCVFAGIVILHDPVRVGVEAAITGVRAAGAEILLVTGDNPETALSIARAVGIAGAREIAITGDELAQMSDEEIVAVLGDVHVFARVLPKQKMRLAEILQRQGEIVAMTGDGINDAPALRRANIGIAVGSGTEVAKEASDLVLVNDSFATIYAAIEEGRRIISNLRKIIGYLLATSLSEVSLIGSALLVGAASPLTPAQILWSNIIEEGLMSVAFAFEKGEKNAMRRRPQDIQEEGIVSVPMRWFLALVVTVLSSLSVALYFYLRSLGVSPEVLSSAMFVAISMDSLFISLAFRSLSTPLWKMSWWDNRFFIGSFFISAALFGLALTVPFLQTLLSYQPLPLEILLLAISFSVLSLVVVEVAKSLFFEPPHEAA